MSFTKIPHKKQVLLHLYNKQGLLAKDVTVK